MDTKQSGSSVCAKKNRRAHWLLTDPEFPAVLFGFEDGKPNKQLRLPVNKPMCLCYCSYIGYSGASSVSSAAVHWLTSGGETASLVTDWQNSFLWVFQRLWPSKIWCHYKYGFAAGLQFSQVLFVQKCSSVGVWTSTWVWDWVKLTMIFSWANTETERKALSTTVPSVMQWRMVSLQSPHNVRCEKCKVSFLLTFYSIWSNHTWWKAWKADWDVSDVRACCLYPILIKLYNVYIGLLCLLRLRTSLLTHLRLPTNSLENATSTTR